MRIIKPYVEILDNINGAEMLRRIELAGRVCYKSEDKITDGSAEKFVKAIIKRGHESVLEHEKITVRFVCDRGVTHEIVRHRIASYSQESSRYCNYSPDGKLGGITFIEPCFLEKGSYKYNVWKAAMDAAAYAYCSLLANGATPEEARSVLPNSLKTELVMTADLREWRNVMKLRIDKAAHPQMREVMHMLLDQFREKIPVIFDDIEEKE